MRVEHAKSASIGLGRDGPTRQIAASSAEPRYTFGSCPDFGKCGCCGEHGRALAPGAGCPCTASSRAVHARAGVPNVTKAFLREFEASILSRRHPQASRVSRASELGGGAERTDVVMPNEKHSSICDARDFDTSSRRPDVGRPGSLITSADRFDHRAYSASASAAEAAGRQPDSSS